MWTACSIYKVVLRGVLDASSKSVQEECLTRVSGKSVSQECPIKVSHKSAPQEYATRVSQKTVPHDCPRRVSRKSVLQEWLLMRSSISCSLSIVL